MDKRAVILNTAIIFGFLTVALRLADLMLLNHERLAARATSQHVLNKAIEVGRGGIFDRRGRELAVNVDVESAYYNPGEAEERPEAAARKLSAATGVSYETLLKRFSMDKDFVWVARKLQKEQAERLKGMGLGGLGFVTEARRYYPKGRLGAHVIGFVGVDNQPLEGIEMSYNESLKGRAEKVAYTRDAGGRTISGGVELKQRINNVVLTVDEGLQYILEKELDLAMEKWRAGSASGVMMDPFTGEILAMANRPTYDPNNPSAADPSARRNRAITDIYEPGSTFKLMTAAAALEEGVVDLNSHFDCSRGYITVGGKVIKDVHRKGLLSFKEVIQHSSNVGSIQIGMKVGKENLYKRARGFGFGRKTGIDLPGESGGILTNVKRWSSSSLATVSIGYGVGVTPLQVLRAYSAVANGGLLVRPHIVKEVLSPEGATLYRFEPGQLERAISKKTADTLREILVSVTEEHGTATSAAVEGNLVAGKTGTARLIDPETGKYSTTRYASSFVGFVPADNPKVAVIIVVYEPKGAIYGGVVAAPVFKSVADKTLAYLNVPRDDADGKNVMVVQKKDREI